MNQRVVRGLMLVLAVALAGCSSAGTEGDDGTALPALTMVDLADPDHSIELASITDAPRVINLWATWCAPCRSELPAFDEVAGRAGSNIAMLGINVGEDVEQAAWLIDELGIGFPQAVDPTGDVTAELGIAGLPATLFATGDGEILDVHSGPLDADELISRIDEHFGVDLDA